MTARMSSSVSSPDAVVAGAEVAAVETCPWLRPSSKARNCASSDVSCRIVSLLLRLHGVDEPLAQRGLLPLAGRRARDGVDVLETLGELPLGEVLRQMGTELLGIRLGAVAERDDGEWALAPAV